MISAHGSRAEGERQQELEQVRIDRLLDEATQLAEGVSRQPYWICWTLLTFDLESYGTNYGIAVAPWGAECLNLLRELPPTFSLASSAFAGVVAGQSLSIVSSRVALI